MESLERTRGSILGLAIGDALGHPTELVRSVPAIKERWGGLVVDFQRAGAHPPGTVTDDTQRTFTRACVEALDEALLVEVGCAPELARSIGNRELEALDETVAALDEETEDVCELLGGAWIGEEAVATALRCVLKAKGAGGIDPKYREGVEKASLLDALAKALHGAKRGADLDPTGGALDPYGAEEPR